MSKDKYCDYCRMKLARAYILRLRGYEEATMILKDRYLYALYEGSPDAICLRAEFMDMERRANLIRKELFRSLRAMDNDCSRKILWQLYIERKQPDEVARWLGISASMIHQLHQRGLCSLDMPAEYIETVMRRWNTE